MLNDLLLSSIQLREAGDNLTNIKFSYTLPSLMRVEKFRSVIKKNQSSQNSLGSETVWIGGKENILATLNSHGQVICYDLLDDNRSVVLTETFEHAFKIFFAGESLFMVVKSDHSDFLNFFLVSIEGLPAGSCSRTKIFDKLHCEIRNLRDLDSDTCSLVVEKGNSIQIWHILTNTLIQEFPFNPSIQYQYSSGCFIFWETGKSDTKLGIISLENSTMNQIIIKTTSQINACEIIKSNLLLEIQNCHLQIINIFTGQSHIFTHSKPLAVYKNDTCNSIFVLFSDKTFATISDKITLCNERLDSTGEVFYSNLGEYSILSDKTGKVWVAGERIEKVFDGINHEIQQIGVNPDANHIYLASREEIFVIE